MIRSEQITELTPDILSALTADSRESATLVDNVLPPGHTVAVYDDERLLLVLTINRTSLLMPAELYLLVGQAYGVRYAKQTKQVMQELIQANGGFYTTVRQGFTQGCRFAKFFGFRPRGEVFELANGNYQMYEVYP